MGTPLPGLKTILVFAYPYTIIEKRGVGSSVKVGHKFREGSQKEIITDPQLRTENIWRTDYDSY
jgi:hypothetical protein